METNPPRNPWTTLATRPIYENRWIAVTENDVITPGQSKGIYGKVHFKNKAIGIIPLAKDGFTWLVGQYRYTLDAYSWEIPEGGGPPGEDPLDTAKRELKEETGLEADQWTPVMRFHTSNSVTDEEGLIFLAEDLDEGAQQLEITEADLKVWHLPFKEALDLVLDGSITDSMSVAGILKVARMKGI